MDEINFCVDCKWCKINEAETGSTEKYVCHHPKLINIVTGKPKPSPCYIQREVSDNCGRNGQRFEPKENNG